MKTSYRKFLNLAHYFPYDVKLRLLAHSRSFLANQKARNAIVGAENLPMKVSLRSCRDFALECFSFGSEALNASGKAVRGLVKSRVVFPPAQNSWFFLFFFNYVFSSARKFVLVESTETSIKC